MIFKFKWHTSAGEFASIGFGVSAAAFDGSWSPLLFALLFPSFPFPFVGAFGFPFVGAFGFAFVGVFGFPPKAKVCGKTPKCGK